MTRIAAPAPDGIVLGDPGAAPVVLTDTNLLGPGADETIPWEDVERIDLTVPRATPLRRAWSWTSQVALAAFLEQLGSPAALRLDIARRDGEQLAVEAICHTTAGYPRREAERCQQLLTSLVADRSLRHRLASNPDGLLHETFGGGTPAGS